MEPGDEAGVRRQPAPRATPSRIDGPRRCVLSLRRSTLGVPENGQTPGRTEAAVPGSSLVSVPIDEEGSTPLAPPAPLTWQERRLSSGRLGPYLNAAGDLERALLLYDWNARLAGAFWEVIEGLEVIVRNAMHDALTSAFGSRWFDDSHRFDSRTDRRVRSTIERVQERIGPKPIPAGLFVSESSFGLWMGLLEKGGKTSGGGDALHQGTLWQPALVNAFPHGPRHQGKTLTALQWPYQLRNRIAHHENLIRPKWVARRGSRVEMTPDQVHQMCLIAAGWIEPDAAPWLDRRSRVLEVLAQRP